MFTMEVEKVKLSKALRIAPQELKKELWNEFDHIPRSFLSTFRKTRLQGPPGIYGDGKEGLFGQFKKRQIGRNPAFCPIGDASDMGFEILSNSKTIGPRHEFGIPLLPQGDHLLIPFRANPDARQRMYTAGKKPRLKKQYRDAGNVKKMFSMRVKGSEYLVKRFGEKLVFLYIKKNKAEYKDALGFYDTWNGMIPKAIDYMNRAVDRALARL